MNIGIIELVEKYTNLRQRGREWWGLCPFHSEKTPSFAVNENKGVFHCWGCGEGGDVIAFVQKIEHLSFPEALQFLGVAKERKPRIQPFRIEAEQIAIWGEMMSEHIARQLRLIGIQKNWLDEFEDRELAKWKRKNLERRWQILESFDKELGNPTSLVVLWEQRDALERLVCL